MRAVVMALFCTACVDTAHAQLALTPSQTEGPYYPRRVKPSETDNDLTRISGGQPAKGEPLVINGSLVDPTGKPIDRARIEIWQTDHQGIYLHPGDGNMSKRDRGFQFYGETKSDAAGAFSFKTIIPARYPGRARHIHVKITPPGGATLTTQLYFAGDHDLQQDGLARSLGKALDEISLRPEPSGEPGVQQTTARFVVRR